MAVYTQVPAETLALFLERYDVGTLLAAKGIAEGVENSNYLVDTTGADGNGARFILTLYEKRVDVADLPFFMGLLDHVGARGCPVPRFIHDREGKALQTLCERPAALIEFLNGVSVTHPTPPQARSAGAALGQFHRAAEDFSGERSNTLGPEGWHRLANECGGALDAIQPGLEQRVRAELAYLDARWPGALARGVIHADLFPDNVLMRGDEVGGLIDFYFSCTDIRAYDLAIMHGAWCFGPDGRDFDSAVALALIAGYRATHGLTAEEYAALPVLARGAALRFLLTRAYDWINTPANALVTRKDPLAYLRRLDFYAETDAAALFGSAS
ncbi:MULTISPECIES: homoserine kinase [unclassified Sphingobium]|uniref:homoserine kinase n=1 Tax=unclassified Sphingobium TaxID=2611147 RepID=UPI002225335C|nr:MULTISPECIES: homoserine kinase [unclassified Sphingobium]MCW2413042.1 homoserine kinase type II [Sphingobium sp. B8D3D]MCW2414659.1 homoserine kinase type II [Sphingobium sp. B8D3A]